MKTGSLTVGQIARLLGISHKRVQWWIRHEFLFVEPWVYGRGHYFRVPQSEVEVAARAIEMAREYGVHVTKALFAKLRGEMYGDSAQAAPENPA